MPIQSGTHLGPYEILYFAGSFDRAFEQLNKTLELAPQNPQALALLADAYACSGETEKATEKCLQALASAPGVTFIRGNVAATYAKIGKIAEARTIVERAEKAWKPGDASAFWIAAAQARLGEKDAAFEWLERAFQKRTFFLVHFKVHHLFDTLHGDPRFDDLVKRIGIPD